MTLSLFNSLTKHKEEFRPATQDQISFYACGPTVYDAAHIGNLRTYVFEDTLRRWLEEGHGLKVRLVMNITDVEDKILAASQAKTVAEMRSFTKPFEQRFHDDLAALSIQPAEAYPRATDNLPAIIRLIEAILKAGFAYERDGSVYFDVRKYDAAQTYGRLTKIDFAGFADGHRIDNDEYDKDNVQDFALWKAAPGDSPGWDSPWGHGRPGWHIECSAMAAGELGAPVDIHAGAVDLKFPHHENEIAQTQAGQGTELARTWVHAEHLLVDGAKMAKSAGNFYTLADVTDKGFEPSDLRLLFLQSHYRSKLNFTWDSLHGARKAAERLADLHARLHEAFKAGSLPALSKAVEQAQQRFDAAMDDDLNTPEALAALFDLTREANTLLDGGNPAPAEVLAVQGFLSRCAKVLGLPDWQPTDAPAPVRQLVEARETARQAGDFSRSDELREQLSQLGWSVEDTDAGPRLRKQP